MLQSQIPITYFKFRNSEFNSSKWTHPSWPDELSTKLNEDKIYHKNHEDGWGSERKQSQKVSELWLK